MKNAKLILTVAVVAIIALLTGCPAAPTVEVAPIVFSPEAGIYNYDQTVTITCSTEGAIIYYTTDGTEPSYSSTLYSGPIEVSGHQTSMEIKAVAVSKGLSSSEGSCNISINYGAYPAITGSITTGAGVDLANVKVGLFFKGSTDGPNPTTNVSLNDDVDSTAPSGRVYHNDSNIGTGDSVSIAPTRLGVIDETESTYALSIPSTIPERSGSDWSEGYYALAWYDTNGDGNLDLKNGAVTDYADQGEYNRMPVKSVELNGKADTSCYVDFIDQNQLDPTGYQFKYYNVTNDNDYTHIGLTAETSGDFNFTIDAVTDTK